MYRSMHLRQNMPQRHAYGRLAPIRSQNDLPPPGDPAVQYIEHQRGKDQRGSIEDMPCLGRLKVAQHGKKRPCAADRVGQGEPVGELEIPDE